MGTFRCTARALLIAAMALSGCAQIAKNEALITSNTFQLANDPLMPPWQAVHIRFKTPTSYTRAEVEGVPCILAESQGTWSLQAANVPPALAHGSVLSWRWFVPKLPVGADNEISSKDDAAARVLIAFKGDRSSIDAADRSAMNMAKLIGGWEIPFASIQYIWEPDAALGTIITHPTISRIKKMVVRTGERGLANWITLERNVRDDLRRAFPGEEPGSIESIGIMTDSDTLGGYVRACYADLQLR